METPQGVKVVFQHYYINPTKVSPAAQGVLSNFQQKLSDTTSKKDFEQWMHKDDPTLIAVPFSFLDPFLDLRFGVSQLPNLTDQVNAMHAALRIVGDVMVSKIARFKSEVAQRDAVKEVVKQLLGIPDYLAYNASAVKGESEEDVRLLRSQLHTLNAYYTLQWAAEMSGADAQNMLLAAAAISLYRLMDEVDQTHYPELISQIAESLTSITQNNPKLLETLRRCAFNPLAGFVKDLISGTAFSRERVVAPAIFQAICLKVGADQAKSYKELRSKFLKANEFSGSKEFKEEHKDLNLLATTLAHYYITQDAEFIKGFLADYSIYERAYLLPHVLLGVGFDEKLFASGCFDDLAVSLVPGGIIGRASYLAGALADLEGKVPPTSPYYEKVAVLRTLAELFSAPTQNEVSEEVKARLLEVEPPPLPSAKPREPLKSAKDVNAEEVNKKAFDALQRKLETDPELAFVDPMVFGFKSMVKELQLRLASAKDVAERLCGDQKFLSEFAKSALNFNPFGKVDKETAKAVTQLLTAAFYDKWGHTSTDGPFMVAMHLSAAHEFGLQQSAQYFQDILTRSEDKSYDWHGGCYIFNTIGHILRSILRTIYNRTQEILAREGIDEVAVYRGLVLPKGWVKKGKTEQVTHFPLSSWSFNLGEAREFARRHSRPFEGLEGVVFYSAIPRERIFAISGLTGGGCAKELEVIVVGSSEGKDTTYVLG
jgi:hypothetical protein